MKIFFKKLEINDLMDSTTLKTSEPNIGGPKIIASNGTQAIEC